MTRRLDHRDISGPIEQIVRDHLNAIGVAAIWHGPLTRALVSAVNDLIQQAMDHGVHRWA